MKFKISIICLLLISMFCLSAVCAADLNQTADDIKTNDENDDSVVLNDDDGDVSVYDASSTKNDDAGGARIEKLIELDDGVKPTQQAGVDDGVKPIRQLVRVDDNIILCNFTPELHDISVIPKVYNSGALFSNPWKNMSSFPIPDSPRPVIPSVPQEPIAFPGTGEKPAPSEWVLFYMYFHYHRF